jgi:hypothetical protein
MSRLCSVTPVRAALLLVAMVAATVAAVLPATAADAAAGCQHLASGATRTAHFGGIARPLTSGGHACASNEVGGGIATSGPYGGSPPLLDHGGPIMSTPSVSSRVVITPIFWAPPGFSFTASYKNVILKYLGDVAADSGKVTNVFATNTQYPGSNGTASYHVVLDSAITDTHAFPASGCTLNGGAVYSDGTGYSTCLDDDQLTAEIGSVVSANGFTSDLGHIYPIFTPKGVESCFYAGNPDNQQCTINPSPSTAFCAYHSYFGDPSTPTVYANMPFPVYQSATNASCTDEGLGGGIQSPSGDVDADVEVSPLSHELSEAFTDPELDAWYDAAGNENGDDCAYIYGSLSGSAGTFYNQVINGHHYLTQEEFSNDDFVPGVSGCIQQEEAPVPEVSAVAPPSGPTSGGQTVTVTGSGFTGATSVTFGGTAGTGLDVSSDTSLTVDTPAGSPGTVDVRVTAPGGTSPVVSGDHYTYAAAPTVASVAPASGPVAGGQTVTIQGTHLAGATDVFFGTAPASAVTVVSDTEVQVTAPAHRAGTVDVRVTTPGGTSAAATDDRYRFAPVPKVTRLSSSSGTRAGGRRITVTGTGFTGATTVLFGAKPGTHVNVVSGTRLTVTTPSHKAGTVDVHVRTPGGTSAEVHADRYTFTRPHH